MSPSDFCAPDLSASQILIGAFGSGNCFAERRCLWRVITASQKLHPSDEVAKNHGDEIVCA